MALSILSQSEDKHCKGPYHPGEFSLLSLVVASLSDLSFMSKVLLAIRGRLAAVVDRSGMPGKVEAAFRARQRQLLLPGAAG